MKIKVIEIEDFPAYRIKGKSFSNGVEIELSKRDFEYLTSVTQEYEEAQIKLKKLFKKYKHNNQEDYDG